ncbi:DUF350 domain-containing protein [Clostridium sp. BJN0001]|uniref:DUF350 domain-containing protein n=1 Tax=Clostridium sp. BJN0001 TaxID=2930219 RepID=UPI001FD165B1|nr:DUF350 domain-containing protein [Clostridium sp. BJN0001]
MDAFMNDAVHSIVFGIIGIVFLILGYGFFDIILKKIDFSEELKNKNVAVAIVIAGFLIALGIVIAAVVA